jgi:hypothetical protein
MFQICSKFSKLLLFKITTTMSIMVMVIVVVLVFELLLLNIISSHK